LFHAHKLRSKGCDGSGRGIRPRRCAHRAGSGSCEGTGRSTGRGLRS
jgi:hypothetical protein